MSEHHLCFIRLHMKPTSTLCTWLRLQEISTLHAKVSVLGYNENKFIFISTPISEKYQCSINNYQFGIQYLASHMHVLNYSELLIYSICIQECTLSYIYEVDAKILQKVFVKLYIIISPFLSNEYA